MNDQIVQVFTKIFPNSHKNIAHLLKKSIPISQKKFRSNVRRGKKCMSLKNVLAAIFYRVKLGCPWRQVPEFFGNWRTIYGWYRKFALGDFFGNLYQKLIIDLQKRKPKWLERLIFDGFLVPAKNGGTHVKRNPRAQNKSVTNVMCMSSGKGLALNFLITSGTTHDSKLLKPLFNSSRDLFQNSKPSIVHADKGFDAREIRLFLWKNGCRSCIPYREFKNRIYPKRRRDRFRGRIERYFARLKQFRALSATFNRTIESLRSDLFIAALAILSEKIPRREMNMCFESI